jgi:SNF2 family DNA or RNA helicase
MPIEVKLILKNDLFVLKTEVDYFPSVEEIYSYQFHGAGLLGINKSSIKKSDSIDLIKVGRKPSKLMYIFEDDQISPIHENRILKKQNIDSITDFGYFLEANKLFTFTPETRSVLKDVIQAVDIKSQLSILAELHSKRLLEGDSPQLLSSLQKEFSAELVIDMDEDYFKANLYPYQREGVRWLLHCYLNGVGTILGDDMGLGKTAQIIALISECHKRSLLKSAVIVVPNSLLENWKREFNFFCPSITPYFHTGSIRTGLSENLENYLVVIIPYSIVSNDIEMLHELKPDLLVFDEASLLKNPDSARTIASKRLQASCKIAMTGTPIENSLVDLWSITDLVFPGYLGSKESFKKKYVEKTIDETLENDLSGLESLINQILIRRMKTDVLDQLPSKIDIDQPIIMSKNEQKFYDETIYSIQSNENSMECILQTINVLQQYTAHPELLNDNVNFDLDHLLKSSSKLQRLIEILDQVAARKEKALIFANHIKAIDILKFVISKIYSTKVFGIDGRVEASDRLVEIDDFSAQPEFSVMILNPTTAGMGLNITASNHVIHYSRQWNPALEEQATARAYRNKQSKEVNVYYMFYAGTIEEIIDERLRTKRALSSRVIGIVDDKESEMDTILKCINKWEFQND